MKKNLEAIACKAIKPCPDGFNYKANLPYGCVTEHIYKAMCDFSDFLGFINEQLFSKGLNRLESFLMPANFSSIVGEFMHSSIPRYSLGLVKNCYHNGHPDLIPKGRFKNNSAQHANEGIEIKASRYLKGWQGHNPEDTWLMVFVFDSNRPVDEAKGVEPKPFRFLTVLGAAIQKDDWLFAGRSETSRRTITASVTQTGYNKMAANWIYKEPGLQL